MDISELDLSVRDFNAVKRSGINTTEELIERLPNFCLTARKTGVKVMEVLHARGLLPFHLGEWVEPDRCGEELCPEELQEGGFVIMGFPTESRDWRKVVLIEKIDGETLHYRDGSSGLPHTPIRARKVWRIAGERGQAPPQTELEALGVPKPARDLLAGYDITSLAEFKQHSSSLCRACPSAVREVYTALQNAGQIPFVPGDEPEDTDLIGEKLSYSDLQSMPGELIVYADSEYDTPFVALITRVTDETVWIWGDLRHPYSVTESEFTEDCKAFRIKTNNTPKTAESEGICMNEIIMSEKYTRAVTLTSSIRSKAETANDLLFAACQELKIVHDERLYKELGYKNFDDYCESETGFTRQYVLDTIKICELGEDFVNSSLHIGKKKLIMLSKLDATTRETVTETVDLESITVKELKEQIKSLTDENAENEHAAKLLSEELSTAKDNIAKKEKQFAEAMESKKRELDSFKDSAERSKKSLTARIGDLEKQIMELENRPIEVAVSEEEVKEIERLRAELEDSRLRQVQAEKAAQVKADLAVSTVREEYEKQLAEERAAVRLDAVPDTKGIFKAYYTNAVDAMHRVTQFVSEHTADENMPLYLKKLDDIIAFAETELTKLKEA